MLNCIVTESSSIRVRSGDPIGYDLFPRERRKRSKQHRGVIEIPNLLAVSVGEAKSVIEGQEQSANWGRDGF